MQNFNTATELESFTIKLWNYPGVLMDCDFVPFQIVTTLHIFVADVADVGGVDGGVGVGLHVDDRLRLRPDSLHFFSTDHVDPVHIPFMPL